VAPEDPDPTPVASDLAPLVVMLSRGRVEYTDVTLPVHGHATRVVGDHGLGGTDLDLQVELPIEIVGENVNLLLHNVRDRFQPDFGVPIVISGATMEDLDLSVRPQWIRTVNDVLGQLIPDTLKDTVREILTEDEASSQDR
jgi:hypothetical protein